VSAAERVTPRQALHDRLTDAARRIKQCEGSEVACTPCRHEINDVMDAADAYAYACGSAPAQPAPELAALRSDEFARVKVRLSALVASLDETVSRAPTSECGFDQGAAHASAVTARQLRAILNDTALGRTPQAAPELASVTAERDRFRIALERIADGSRNRDGMMGCAGRALAGAARSGPQPVPDVTPAFEMGRAFEQAQALGEPLSACWEAAYQTAWEHWIGRPAAEPQPAPELAEAMRETASKELAAAMAEARGYRQALQQVAEHHEDAIAQVRIVAGIARRALEGK